MRVIAGVHRGRRLFGPRGNAIRPTSDRVKEALFSILGTRVTMARVLDLFAGTGSIGIEALSRGATHVTFVESDGAALRLVQANLERCGFQQQATVYGFPVQNFFRRETDRLIPYDIVFCDPPYASVPDLVTIIQRWRADWLTDDALVVIEHGKHTDLPRRSAL